MQLVGQLAIGKSDEVNRSNDYHSTAINGDVAMTDDDTPPTKSRDEIAWRLEFRDIPDAGKQSTSVRLMFRVPIQGFHMVPFMSNLGFELVALGSRHVAQY